MAKMMFWAAVCLALTAVGSVAATEYTVGGSSGWGFSNYTTWLQGKTFRVGDKLVFNYQPSQHDVLEVNKTAYGNCQSSNPIQKHTSGKDTITLSSAGTRYFICGFTGHCATGMKLEVTVMAAATPKSSPAPSPSPSSSKAASPAPSKTSPSPAPSKTTPSPAPSSSPSPPAAANAPSSSSSSASPPSPSTPTSSASSPTSSSSNSPPPAPSNANSAFSFNGFIFLSAMALLAGACF